MGEQQPNLQKVIKKFVDPGLAVERILQTSAFHYFFNRISQAGFLLFTSAILAFVWANVDSASYHHFWHQEFTFVLGRLRLHQTLGHFINDGLMTIFFLTVGLEIKRELLVGGLSDPKRAALPVAAAVGGMLLPAAIYSFINNGGPGAAGWGIPMATDIAFSLAVISTLGKSIPFGARIFLTALAIVDDLGAIVVIALFYTPAINLLALFVSLGLVVLLWLLNVYEVRILLPYNLVCLLLWFALLASGLHATLAGVITAVFIPSTGKYDTDIFLAMVSRKLDKIRCEDGTCGESVRVNRRHLTVVQEIQLACHEVETPLQRLEHNLSSWVGYLVLPIFALANAGVALGDLDLSVAMRDTITFGVGLGLILGKPVGIFLFTYIIAKLLGTSLIQGTNWTHILGAGFLGGIGFTMSLFIGGLSFDNPLFLEYAKLGIMLGSLICAIIGYIVLRYAAKAATKEGK
jgi:NhaA family Na+:H+ antiporter